LVQRFYAERYLLIVLLGFSASVTLTRIFLELTGYPQLGNSELHITHVLWGGLALFLGSLIPLIYVNKRAFDLSAILSGIGVGLFIDEVGKFVTQSNDYFYPAAAPIIYLFFLIMLMIYVIVKKERNLDERARLFQVMEQFEEVLEVDLSIKEYKNIIDQLSSIIGGGEKEIASRLANDLIVILDNEKDHLVAHEPDFLEKFWNRWLKFEGKIFFGREIKKGLIYSWLLLGIFSVFHSMSTYLVANGDGQGIRAFVELFKNFQISYQRTSLTGWIRIGGEIFLGACLIISAILARVKRYRFALDLAFYSLVVMLILINVFVFYYDQFSAILLTIIQFFVFFITARYRNRSS
jgi:hypothetical protein